MDSTLVATVISILGAGFLGLLGYFLQALRADLRGVGTRLDRVEQSLARVEATQAGHSRQLDRMAGQGERIAALEGARAAGA